MQKVKPPASKIIIGLLSYVFLWYLFWGLVSSHLFTGTTTKEQYGALALYSFLTCVTYWYGYGPATKAWQWFVRWQYAVATAVFLLFYASK